MTRRYVRWSLCGVLCLFVPVPAQSADPVNLAPKATAAASSEFSGEYRAVNAVGGTLPSPFHADDDWAVRGTQTGSFTLTWNEPVQVAQIRYFARVTSPLLECFKDYEVYLDDSETPVAKGTLEHRRGPQRITFAQQQVSKLRLEFLSSHPTSPNPGAAEIAVFSEPVTDEQLAERQVPPQEKTPEARALRRDLIEGKLGFRDILLVKRRPPPRLLLARP